MAKISSTGSMEKVFSRYDADGDGKISPSDLGKGVRALESDVSDREVEVMIEEMDANRDGVVDLQEFVEFQRGGGGGGGKEEVNKDAFDIYDLDKNGVISDTELHKVMGRLGESCSAEDCKKMIEKVDKDGDGGVNLEEFEKMMGDR